MSKIAIPRKTIDYNGHAISVRGLSVNDLSLLAAKYYEDLARLIKAVTTDPHPDRRIRNVLVTAPGLAVEMIAYAADIEDKEEKEALDRLPATIQLQLLGAVLEQTIVSSVDLELAVEAVGSLLETMAQATEKLLPSGSDGGSSDGEKTPPSSPRKVS